MASVCIWDNSVGAWASWVPCKEFVEEWDPVRDAVISIVV